MVGNSGPKRSPRKLKTTAAAGMDYPSPEEISETIEALGKDSKRIADALGNAKADIGQLLASGLTPDALVVLTLARCGTFTTDGGRTGRPNAAMVRCVLEAFLNIGDYLR